ncbi:cupin domain-containing protein [Halodesulfovibrio aestuarii]|uniref:Cupin domain-containing protein n=1 Tax=Halodesulfovibrio aestuarii TaxID=126333 RepID=A0ABV4JTX2_9BACT
MGKRIVTEADVHKAIDNGTKTLRLTLCECIITPQAQDKAEELGVTFIESSLEDAASAQVCSAPASEACAAVPVQAEAPVAPAASAAPASECSEADDVALQVCTLLRDKLPAGTSSDVLEAIVRRVVSAKLGETACATSDPAAATVVEDATCSNGVCFIDGQRLQKQGSSPVPLDEQVFIADAIGVCDDAKLAAGYMEWERASFTRTVESPEIGIILDGELHLTIGSETKIGKAGDMMYFPEGIDITYSTPSSVRIACVNNIQ